MPATHCHSDCTCCKISWMHPRVKRPSRLVNIGESQPARNRNLSRLILNLCRLISNLSGLSWSSERKQCLLRFNSVYYFTTARSTQYLSTPSQPISSDSVSHSILWQARKDKHHSRYHRSFCKLLHFVWRYISSRRYPWSPSLPPCLLPFLPVSRCPFLCRSRAPFSRSVSHAPPTWSGGRERRTLIRRNSGTRLPRLRADVLRRGAPKQADEVAVVMGIRGSSYVYSIVV